MASGEEVLAGAGAQVPSGETWRLEMICLPIDASSVRLGSAPAVRRTIAAQPPAPVSGGGAQSCPSEVRWQWVSACLVLEKSIVS